jgi:single-stranded-DNA-specific exonuclease
MRYLEPFGDANPRPIFRAGNVELAGISRVGEDGGHLRAVVVGEEGGRLDAIGFGMGGRADDMGRGRWDVAFELVEDTWRNRNRIQARLLDARPA